MKFILGLIIGIYTGIALMCLFLGNKEKDTDANKEKY